MRPTPAAGVLLAALGVATACGGPRNPHVLTFAGSAVGAEAAAIRRQLDRFHAAHPSMRVELRPTPDAADQRHQLYVQWLNAHAADPDVLQLDVVWTPEFAAAGWIASLDGFQPAAGDFFPQAIAASRWRGVLYALPWFLDAGTLYWRTDLMRTPPADFDALDRIAARAQREHGLPFGFVWEGARYEGLVTVFLEYLSAYGGTMIDASGRVAVDSDAAVAALTRMHDEIDSGLVPRAVLTWQEEQARFSFENGQAAFMRNWPYAYAPMADASQSRVAGRFAVATMPRAAAGSPTAALGGSVLAINAYSDDRDAAYQLIDFLLQPQQLIERARITGEYPPLRALYETRELADALAVDPRDARAILEHAVARPATPVYTELSEMLQIALHGALTDQQSPQAALHGAAASMQALLDRLKLSALR